jgi:hypothetical protein
MVPSGCKAPMFIVSADTLQIGKYSFLSFFYLTGGLLHLALVKLLLLLLTFVKTFRVFQEILLDQCERGQEI